MKYLGFEPENFDSRCLLFREKVLAKFGKPAEARKEMNKRLIQMLSCRRPAVLLAMKGELVEEETLQAARKLGILTVNWFPDYIDAFDLALKLSGYYDCFFHFDPYAVNLLKKQGRRNVFYLPFAADILPDDSLPPPVVKKYRLVFVGNYQSPREEFLYRVSDLGLSIWGDEHWRKTRLAGNYRGSLPFADLNKILRQAEIGLNIQHSYPSFGVVLRIFETVSAGSFLLTQDKEDLKNLFTVGFDLEVFEKPEELREKADYYLKHESTREKIAQNGWLKARTEHAYTKRFAQMFERIGFNV